MIEEKEPKYVAEFRKRFESLDNDIGEIKEKLDVHFEEIGGLKTEMTKVHILLREKKADKEDMQSLERRTGKLERAVFA